MQKMCFLSRQIYLSWVITQRSTGVLHILDQSCLNSHLNVGCTDVLLKAWDELISMWCILSITSTPPYSIREWNEIEDEWTLRWTINAIWLTATDMEFLMKRMRNYDAMMSLFHLPSLHLYTTSPVSSLQQCVHLVRYHLQSTVFRLQATGHLCSENTFPSPFYSELFTNDYSPSP